VMRLNSFPRQVLFVYNKYGILLAISYMSSIYSPLAANLLQMLSLSLKINLDTLSSWKKLSHPDLALSKSLV
jgi:hypothetical protein